MRIEHHPEFNIWVREDGCVYLPQNYRSPAHWTFGNDNGHGYKKVSIGNKKYYVHRLVAEAFLQFPIPEGCEIDHRDRCPAHNNFENIRIVTRSENMRNTSQHDLVEMQGRTHLYEDEKQYNREQKARYYAENKDKVREQHARYYAENKDKVLEQQAHYRAKHPEKERERSNRYNQARRKTHRVVRFSDGSYHWVPHAEALELLKIPLKERIFNEKHFSGSK